MKAISFAQENDCLLFETSALTNENIESAFEKLITTILNKIENGEVADGDYSARKHVASLSTDRLL